MNTFQLSCFLAVASTLSFARAAEQLNVSQPAITHQIKMLENELNAKLFRRSTRMVEITSEGQSFISDAKSMIAISEQAKLRFCAPDDRPMESISIGCSSYAQMRLLTEILHELNGKAHNFHPHLFVVPHDQLFPLLESERVDIIFDMREGCEPKGDLKYKELVKSSLLCVCRSDCALAQKESLTIQELENEPLIFCNPFTLAPDIAKLQWKLAEGKTPADIHFCSSSDVALMLADAGIGAAILPDVYTAEEAHIAKIKLEDAPALSFGMFYKTYPRGSCIGEFIQITKSYFSENVR